ncbi:MAG: DUF2029 domain-containing protein [Clostridia bacterium]|nr:DUF2029 domain-containing protein [Clostridia bacterium]NCC42214.1 DUF2029 domain-containing protein [Clostridia bacterium]
MNNSKKLIQQRKSTSNPVARWAGRMKNTWQGMKIWNNDELCKLDWIISGLILFVLFITCLQGDIRLTGNRSFLMYEHFTDFYKASFEQSGGYYANYLPSTFLAYAIWNLPLYLTGHLPEAILTNSFINMMWYKLLPVLLYFATAHIIYKIGVLVGFGEKKARLCKFAFLVFPIAVYSQFIFSQYDIFTVFFMILGLYFYMKGGMWKFALMFGLATTFKYHAVLYFLVLLVLKEKKIRNMLKYAALMVIPVLVEVLPNLGSIYFRRNVLGFGVLKFVQKPFTLGFFSGINLVAAVAAFVLVWAYQRKTRDAEDLFSWATFLTTAISFSIFGFSSWNPQWLLILVPFLVLNIFINENGNMLLMVTNIFMLALYIFTSQSLVDETVLNGGILKYILPETSFAVRMWDLYMFHNEEILCSAMWVVLLVYVVFGHPRYHNRKGTIISQGLMWQIRSAFLFGVAAFVVPMGICAAAMLQGHTVFFDNSRQDLELENVVQVDESSSAVQDIVAMGNELSEIEIRVCTGERSISENLHVQLADKETGEVVYEAEEVTDGFTKNSGLYTFVDGPVDVENGKTYELEITSEAAEGSGIGLYCVTSDKKENQLQMRVTGVH